MNLSQIIEKIKTNNSLDDYIQNPDELLRELGFDYGWWCIDDVAGRDQLEKRLESAYISKHLCTDTWVGEVLYWFDGVLIAISSQSARKSGVYFSFFEAAKEKIDELTSIVATLFTPDNEKKFIEFDDEDLGKGYQVHYGTQLLTKVVHRNSDDEKLSVIGKIPYHYDIGVRNEEKLRVRPMYSNGDCGPEETILLSDVYIPWGE